MWHYRMPYYTNTLKRWIDRLPLHCAYNKDPRISENKGYTRSVLYLLAGFYFCMQPACAFTSFTSFPFCETSLLHYNRNDSCRRHIKRYYIYRHNSLRKIHANTSYTLYILYIKIIHFIHANTFHCGIVFLISSVITQHATDLVFKQFINWVFYTCWVAS